MLYKVTNITHKIEVAIIEDKAYRNSFLIIMLILQIILR